MAKVIRNNLGYLGIDFQYKLISAFITDTNFFKDLSSIIDQNMFSDSYLRTIVGVLKDYYAKHESVPSFSTLQFMLNDKSNTDDDLQYYDELLDKLKKMSTEGIDEVEELSEKFFKQQNWVRVANEILRIAGDGDMSKYDDCQRLMEEAMAVSRKEERWCSPYDNVEDDLAKENCISVPTGISKLDETLSGGLDKGKIGLIIGSSGFGKTSMTTCISVYASTCKDEQNDYCGYRVLQIVFEDTNRDINRKIFSKISSVETCKLNQNEETTEYVRRMVENNPDRELMKNNHRIVKLRTGEYSASKIVSLIKRVKNEGFNPDMVVIDYFECIEAEKGTKNISKWEQESKTMRVLENAAHELDIALWVPVQGNRDSISAELVTMDKAGGAIQKVQIAQVILSITRSLDDTNNQKATLSVLKNRSGSAGIILNGIKFDNGTCTITCDETIELDDVLTFNSGIREKEAEIKRNMIKDLRKNGV